MSELRDAVRRELDRFRRETGSSSVSRQELLEQALPRFERQFPGAQTPGQTMSRVLQELGRRDEITLHGGGLYEIHTLSYEHGTPDGEVESDGEPYHAETSDTVVGARSLPTSFRRTTLARFGCRCPVSGVDHERLLDVAHVLSWSEHPDHRLDPGNVLVLDRTHHAAFDRGLFTIDAGLTLRTNPSLETDSAVLERTLVEADGSTLTLPDPVVLDTSYLSARNEHHENLDWFPA
ncbi:HNH endonuclease [Salinigranum halophilum]|uniref:HNH endonuclease n=1 Tax=Salinigranum halophilum TaxID=2565931 RepID=UPI00137606C2|nr:HNH endonuclease signature motif containing protein [Salinigranum halophilum]